MRTHDARLLYYLQASVLNIQASHLEWGSHIEYKHYLGKFFQIRVGSLAENGTEILNTILFARGNVLSRHVCHLYFFLQTICPYLHGDCAQRHLPSMGHTVLD